MGVRNGRQRLGVDRADESAMFPPNESGVLSLDQLNTESATLVTCSRALRSDLRRAIALIP
jgi:hypothetical protein